MFAGCGANEDRHFTSAVEHINNISAITILKVFLGKGFPETCSNVLLEGSCWSVLA